MCLRVWKENYRILHTRMALLNVMKKKHQKKIFDSSRKKVSEKSL
ncbi:hypothetical protein HE1_00367 [Holospora elegans E1]|uniref:Uncharacterized protein n=1 Tax=Holospora elegans E1 TaxID=1427503 RepID=A0A023DYZ8_9PROT|nr:hypothetical protein HE1_00367 [Holospora elegans E1]